MAMASTVQGVLESGSRAAEQVRPNKRSARAGLWMKALTTVLAVVWSFTGFAEEQKIEYCTQNVDAPEPINRCFDTLKAAENFLKQEPTPAVGRSLLVPTSPSQSENGNFTIYYRVPRRAPDRLFGSWYWSTTVNGAGSWGTVDCGTRVPISSVTSNGCPDEETLKARLLTTWPYGPEWSGSYRGEYAPMPPTSWTGTGIDTATGRSFVAAWMTSPLPGGQGGREFVATSGNQTYFDTVRRTDYYMCPQYFYGDSSVRGGVWPLVCFNEKDGYISVHSRQYDSCTKNGNPCVAATGNKEYRETDFQWDGLSFARAYNSIRDIPTLSGMGGNWAHTFSDWIINRSSCGGDTCLRTWVRSDGYYEEFHSVGGNAFKSTSRPSIVMYREQDDVAAISGRWRISLGGGKQLRFAENGKLIRIDQGARSYDLKYCSAPEFTAGTCAALDKLTKVVSDSGRTLNFEYGEVKVSTGPSADDYKIETVISRIKNGATVLAEYGYDTSARMIGASFPLGSGEQGRSYLYAEPNRLCRDGLSATVAQCDPADFPDYMTGVIDESGKRIATYNYGRYGRVTLSEYAPGIGKVTSDYKDDGSVEVTLPKGAKKKYGFVETPFRKPAEILVTSTDGSLPQRISRTYNWMWLTSSVDADRSRTNYGYNALQETSRVEGLTEAGATTAFTRSTQTDWHTNFNEVVGRKVYDASNALVSQQSIVYNARAQVLTSTQTDPATQTNRVTTNTYCETADVSAGACPVVGRLKSVDGPRTDVADITQYVYYPSDDPACATAGAGCAYRKGDLWKSLDALGRATEILRYDASGRVLSVRDANQVTTDSEYDDRGRLLATKQRGSNDATEADDRITKLEYWPTGQVKKVTLPDGSFTTYAYDVANRLTDIADNAGNTIHYTLDADGNREKEDTKTASGTLKRTLSRVYNQLSQLHIVKDAAGNPTTLRYDADGNQDRTTDALGRITDQDHDPLGRLSRTLQDVGGLNVETNYEYNALDQITKVTDPKRLNTHYRYNGFGDQVQLESPDTGITDYTYNAAGLVATKKDANDPVPHSYTYDALNRPKTVSYTASGPADVEYDYDTVNSVCTAGETFAIGRVTAMRTDGTELKYCYDRFGQVTRKVQAVGGKSFTLLYSYTLGGKLRSMTYPDGAVVDYVRDIQGRIAEIGVRQAGGARTVLLNNAAYEPFGPVAAWTYGNGRILSRSYDLDYRPKTVFDPASGGLSLGYGYNAVGNLIELKDGQNSAIQVKYDYDSVGRLTVTRDGASNTALETYGYDKTGNRTSLLRAGITEIYNYTDTSHRLSRIGAVGRGYDTVGNTTSIGGTAKEFVYNASDRMKQVKLNGVLKTGYRYNAIGERVASITGDSGPVTTHTLYNEAGQWIGDYDSTGATIQQAIWLGDAPVGLLAGAESNQSLAYVQPDHLNTPRSVIDPVRNVAIWTWDAKSEVFGSTPPNQDPDLDSTAFVFNMRFPGQLHDSSTGLSYNYFRDYEPAIGRYVQSDPIGLKGGLNTFAYVGSSPLSSVDALGLASAIAPSPTLPTRGFIFPTGRELALAAQALVAGGATAAAYTTGAVLLLYSPSLGVAPCEQMGPGACGRMYAKPGREKAKPSREQRPNDCPTGTKPIDKIGLSKEDLHSVKDGINAGAQDWVGISPDGHVWINEDGKASDQGPYESYIP
ncbi:RHS repeat-associated core domain-containing protein [Pseudomonas sp. CGJS7]|uniref:RHS repeat-associated core domain-containing protein n=1 Tax=Pseudomonas sp. CGJS7 TaxID=3109348 RepID=UPI0030088E10